MATKKISELNALTTPESDDLIAIVDASATETKKITYGNISKHIVNVGPEVEEDSRVNFIKSKNLFDKNSNIKIGYIDASGNATTIDTTLSYQDNFILVKPNTTYTISTSVNTIFRMCEYTISRTFIERKMNVGQDASFTFTTSANTYYLKMGGVYTASIPTLQIEEGSAATTYSSFIPNSINVDSIKYTDTLNVGTSIDSRSRVNVLYSKNLFRLKATTTLNGITLTNNGNGTFNLSGIATANTSIYIEVNLGESKLQNGYYTIARKSTGYTAQVDLYQDTTWKATPIYSASTTLVSTYNLSIPSGVNKVRFIIYVANGNSVSLTNESVMLNSGDSAIPFEPYITPSINVDGEEIYSKPVVLWTNPSPASAFAQQNITLNDAIENYSYYEVIYRVNKDGTMCSSIKLPIDFNMKMETNQGFSFLRLCTARSGTSMSFSACVYYSSYGSDATAIQNNCIIPVMVLGYK